MSSLVRQKGGLPLYAQLADVLRELIYGEKLGPGSRLPSEPELVARYGVSRANRTRPWTCSRGKGWFRGSKGAAPSSGTRSSRGHCPSFLALPNTSPKRATAGQRLLSVERARAEEVGSLASPFEADFEVVVVRRVRLVDGEPVGLHRTVLPAVLASRIGFVEERLRREQLSLYGQLRKHGIELAWAEEHLPGALGHRGRGPSARGAGRGGPDKRPSLLPR